MHNLDVGVKLLGVFVIQFSSELNAIQAYDRADDVVDLRNVLVELCLKVLCDLVQKLHHRLEQIVHLELRRILEYD